jgi:glucose-6-phosphate dehydrogenase assembly protein OpcA
MAESNFRRGEDQSVDILAIEKSLTELWRSANDSTEHAVTRAALWNVIAHTDNDQDKQFASRILAEVSAAIPQRSIVIRCSPGGDSEISAWISTNCHLAGGEKQVCSEEISIVAGGEKTHFVPPLVDALLVPELPVAAWWLGDLPHQREGYVLSLLDHVTRLILDSSKFSDVGDLMLFSKICSTTNTFPADLSWERLEEWRVATASVFDPPFMRPRLRSIQGLRIVCARSGEEAFGEQLESFLYAAWLAGQLNFRVDDEGGIHNDGGLVDFRFEHRRQNGDSGAVSFVEIQFRDGSRVRIERDGDNGIIKVDVEGISDTAATVTRMMPRDTRQLIIRQLSHPSDDKVFRRALPSATILARRVAG